MNTLKNTAGNRMPHPNNLVRVNFPGGASRLRNCSSTFTPDNRMPLSIQRFPAYGDFYSKIDRALFKNNELKQKIEKQRFDNNKGNWDVILILILCIAVAIYGLTL